MNTQHTHCGIFVFLKYRVGSPATKKILLIGLFSSPLLYDHSPNCFIV